jgi:hypothetical protein
MIVIRKDVYDELVEKGYGRKDYGKLTKIVKPDKNGVMRTIYIDPNKLKKTDANNGKMSDNGSMRIKSGLKKTEEITDYLSNKLEKMGFKTKTDYSGLSGSQYITITNYSEMTGKESDYNGEELKIRISNHDLPPSYDGVHGYHDIDIMSEGKERAGNDGKAISYEYFLHEVAKKIGLKTPEYDKKLEEIQQRKKEEEERIKQLRENEKTRKSNSLTDSLEKLKKVDEEKYNKMQELLVMLDEHTIEYGIRKNKYTGKERKKMTTKLKEVLKPYGYEPN